MKSVMPTRSLHDAIGPENNRTTRLFAVITGESKKRQSHILTDLTDSLNIDPAGSSLNHEDLPLTIRQRIKDDNPHAEPSSNCRQVLSISN